MTRINRLFTKNLQKQPQDLRSPLANCGKTWYNVYDIRERLEKLPAFFIGEANQR